MKGTLLLFGAFLATIALANPITQGQVGQPCYRSGEPCLEARHHLENLSSIHKRAASASAEAIANAEPKHHFCWLMGEPCSEAKAKRDAPNAEALRTFCHQPDQPCAKIARATDIAIEAMSLTEALPEPVNINGTSNRFCYGSGQPCALARRAALALAEAMPNAEPNHHHFCWLAGEPCSEAKRDALAAAEAEADAQHHFCWLPGEPCSESKRDVEFDALDAQEYCDTLAGPCSVTKRFAAAVVDAIAGSHLNMRSLTSEKLALKDQCYAQGGACDVGKRALEDLEKTVALFL